MRSEREANERFFSAKRIRFAFTIFRNSYSTAKVFLSHATEYFQKTNIHLEKSIAFRPNNRRFQYDLARTYLALGELGNLEKLEDSEQEKTEMKARMRVNLTVKSHKNSTLSLFERTRNQQQSSIAHGRANRLEINTSWVYFP
jgi:hypothetical protein